MATWLKITTQGDQTVLKILLLYYCIKQALDVAWTWPKVIMHQSSLLLLSPLAS